MPGPYFPGMGSATDELERPRMSSKQPDPTAGAPPVKLTFYDLLRHFVRSSRWASNDEEYAAECLIDELERLGMFGSLGETVKQEVPTP